MAFILPDISAAIQNGTQRQKDTHDFVPEEIICHLLLLIAFAAAVSGPS
jgi:hypothetical protein